jgi:hypothetical protein
MQHGDFMTAHLRPTPERQAYRLLWRRVHAKIPASLYNRGCLAQKMGGEIQPIFFA